MVHLTGLSGQLIFEKRRGEETEKTRDERDWDRGSKSSRETDQMGRNICLIDGGRRASGRQKDQGRREVQGKKTKRKGK